MSATMRAWIFHTASSSGTMVSQPIGPTGNASVPAVAAALAAAALATLRAAASGTGLGAVGELGTSPKKSRIAVATLVAMSPRAATETFLLTAEAGYAGCGPS